MDDETVFEGGVNVVRRRGDIVHRPAGEPTSTLHRLLEHLHRQGFDGAPRPRGFDEAGNEMLSYVEGTVYSALDADLRTPRLLASAAVLLRRLHDATTTFPPPPTTGGCCPPGTPMR